MGLSVQTWKDLVLDHKSEMMELELGLQSEVSQKEKDKYCILMHVYGIQEDGTDEPIYRAAVEIQT